MRLSRALLKQAENGISRTLSEILVCPLSKQPLRYCEETNSLISDATGVAYPGKLRKTSLWVEVSQFNSVSDEKKIVIVTKKKSDDIKFAIVQKRAGIKDGIPCLHPRDGKILDNDDGAKPNSTADSSATSKE